MSEGLFKPNKMKFSGTFPVKKALMSIVKIRPLRILSYKMFDSLEEADEWSGSSINEDGSETIKYGVIKKDREDCKKPEFSQALFTHELCEIFEKNLPLPREEKLKGNGTGVMVSSDGYILTNFHLISGVAESMKRTSESVIDQPVEIKGLEVEYPVAIDEDLNITYKKAEKVYLVSNPSAQLAYRDKHDLALLRVEYETDNFLPLSPTNPPIGEEILNIGFTMRTQRLQASKERFDYEDANYDLRISKGEVLEEESPSSFLSDCDAGPGNSGSATLDKNGELVGIYFGSKGNGIVDPSNIKRRHIYSKAVKEFFQI